MEDKVIPNPYGANGTTSDPREEVCWNFYVEALLNGIDNAYASAIKAGYSESAAKNVTCREWFMERLGKLKRKEMFVKAEKVLGKTLDMEAVDQEGKTDVSLLRVQTDVAKFIATTQGKDSGYSTKTDDALTKLADKESTPEQLLKGKLFDEWLKNQTA